MSKGKIIADLRNYKKQLAIAESGEKKEDTLFIKGCILGLETALDYINNITVFRIADPAGPNGFEYLRIYGGALAEFSTQEEAQKFLDGKKYGSYWKIFEVDPYTGQRTMCEVVYKHGTIQK